MRQATTRKDEEQFVKRFMYLLRAPLIVWPGYEDDFKDKWTDVLLHRLAHHKEIFEGEGRCTEYEAMLYVSTASLALPLSHEWAAVYFWLFRRWNPQVAKEIDTGDRDLDPQEQEDLERLRRWIFKKQMLHLKEKERGAKAVERERREVETQQPKLF